MGIIQGFSSKLRSKDKGQIRTKNSKALVPTEDIQLKKWIKARYPRITHIKGRSIRTHQGVLEDGIGIGEKMIISKGIEEKGKGKIQLIGGRNEKTD